MATKSPNPSPSSSQTPPSSSPPQTFVGGQRLRNFLVVLAATLLSVAFFLGLQQQSLKPSLTTLATTATPLETALTNNKPTLVEFYANWCTSCQAMVTEMSHLKQDYGDQVNFVMLNVDNNKWLPEILRFGVDGIPHFVFLDRNSQALASVVGQQPFAVLANNLSALVADQSLPFQEASGQTSAFQPEAHRQQEDGDPRSHGGMPAR